MVKLAVFDVDGTLFDGNMGIEFLKVLLGKQLFPADLGKTIYSWYAKYKSGEVDKALAVDEIYKVYAKGMLGLQRSVAEQVANETFAGVKKDIFPFVPELFSILRREGFELILLSGSPVEMVNCLAVHLSLSLSSVVAGTLGVRGGLYSGETLSYPGSAQQKVDELEKLIKAQNWEVDWSASLAMGDNERDMMILKKVGHPFVIQGSLSNADFHQLALGFGWQVLKAGEVLVTLGEMFK